MSVVNLWKALKLQPHMQFTEERSRWFSVRIAENAVFAGEPGLHFRISSTPINIFSLPFPLLLHNQR